MAQTLRHLFRRRPPTSSTTAPPKARLRPLTHPTTTAFLITFTLLSWTSSFFSICPIRGPSMQPTLSPSSSPPSNTSSSSNTPQSTDYILFWHRYRLTTTRITLPESLVRGSRTLIAPNELRRGMLVLFASPSGETDNEGRGRLAVKRVIALEGDRITPRRPGAKAPSSYLPSATETEAVTVTVPFGHVWVEGDNHAASKDSNAYGPVSKSLIQGVATRIVWPVGRAGRRSWQDDGWEGRLEGRLERRRDDGERVPVEWDL